MKQKEKSAINFQGNQRKLFQENSGFSRITHDIPGCERTLNLLLVINTPRLQDFSMFLGELVDSFISQLRIKKWKPFQVRTISTTGSFLSVRLALHSAKVACECRRTRCRMQDLATRAQGSKDGSKDSERCCMWELPSG